MRWLALALLLGISLTVAAREEAVVAADLERSLRFGETVWLEAEGHGFLALYAPAQTKTAGTVILLHGQGGNPDQAPLLGYLRRHLPERGWSTLSLLLPQRESGATMADYFPLVPAAAERITAALAYLRGPDRTRRVLLGQGLGGLMAAYRLALKPEPADGLVLVDMPVPESDHPYAQSLDFVSKIQLPVLDLYNDRDRTGGGESALKRRLRMQDAPVFRQIRLDAVGTGWRGSEAAVLARLVAWLRNLPETKR